MSNNSKAPSFVIILSFVAFLVLIVGVGAILLSADSLRNNGRELQHSYADSRIDFDDTTTEEPDNIVDPDIEEPLDTDEGLDNDRLVDSLMNDNNDTLLDTDDLITENSDDDSFTIGNSPETNTNTTANNTETSNRVISNNRVEEPVAEAVPVTRVEPRYKDVTKTLYWVQVGSFTTSIQAEEINKKLDSNGIAGIILSKDVNGTIWYRVRVGSFQDRNEAQLYQTQLENLTYISETVIYESQVTERVEITG